MSKVWKGIKTGAKSLVGYVKKGFKKLTESTIGKVLLAAAFVYIGGTALGHWGQEGVFSSIHGTLAETPLIGAGAETASTLAPEVASVAAPGAEVTSLAPTAGAVAPPGATASATSLAPTAGAVAPMPAGGLPNMSGHMAAETIGGSPGLIEGNLLQNTIEGAKGLTGSIGEWGKANPLLAAMTFNGVANAFTPTAAEEQAEMEKERIRNMNQNYTKQREAGVGVGHRGSGQQLKYKSGGNVYGQGAINRNLA